MYQCPHCKQKIVSFRSKWLSWRILPTECRHCAGLSYAPSSRGGALLVIAALLFTAAGFLGIHLRSALPVAGVVALVSALWLARLHVQPLLALSPHEVAQSRKAEGLGWFTLLLLGIMQ